jgi:hypothetical protein
MSSAVMNFSRAEREALLAAPRRRFDPGPPPEALAAVDRAWEVAERLARRGLELNFAAGGVQLRTLRGRVLRTLSPMEAIDVMLGLADPD